MARHQIVRSCAIATAGTLCGATLPRADLSKNFAIDTTGPDGSTRIAATTRGHEDFQEPGVPEPTIWGIIGFGMLGAGRRRGAAAPFA